jgi:hypothetical protein
VTDLVLSDRERELLRPEVAAVAAGVNDPALRDAYAALLAEVEQATVSPDGQGRLEGLLEMGLQTGRFRRQHGAIDAQLLYRLYGRTPHGKALAGELEGVNKAFQALEGHSVDGLTLSAKGPGEYELTVETDNCRIAVSIGGGGVHLSSVEMGV